MTIKRTIIFSIVAAIIIFFLVSIISQVWESSTALTGLESGSKQISISASSMGAGSQGTNSSYSIWFYISEWQPGERVLLSRTDKGGMPSPKITFGQSTNSLTISVSCYPPKKGRGGGNCPQKEGFTSSSERKICVKGATSLHSDVNGIYVDKSTDATKPNFYNPVSKLYLFHVNADQLPEHSNGPGLWIVARHHNAKPQEWLSNDDVVLTTEGAADSPPKIATWKDHETAKTGQKLTISECNGGDCGQCVCPSINGYNVQDSVSPSSNIISSHNDSSAEECKKRCTADDSCTGFVFHPDGTAKMPCSLVHGHSEDWSMLESQGSCMYTPVKEGFTSQSSGGSYAPHNTQSGYKSSSTSPSNTASAYASGGSKDCPLVPICAQHHHPLATGDKPGYLPSGAHIANCTIANVPVQKWVNLVVCTFGEQLDVYLNGKLTRTCLLPGRPRQSGEGDILITPGGGFKGWTARTQYWSRTLTPDEVYDIYKKGFGDQGILGGVFNKYRVRFALMHNGQSEGSFEI